MARTPVVGYLLLAPAAATAQADLSPVYDALGEHSPRVEPDPPDGCWLDLACGRRSPSPERVGAALLATAAEWGYPAARLGVAPTPGVARLAARHGPAPVMVLAPAGVAAFLMPLPVEALGLGGDAADRLRLVGLGTLGAVGGLPRGALGHYLGPEGLAVEALARGEDDRPLVPRRVPLVLAATRALDWPLGERAALAAGVARLLAPLLAELRRRGLGATTATLALDLGGDSREGTARLPQPTTDAAAITAALLAACLPDAPDDGAGDGDGDDEGLGDPLIRGITGVRVSVAAPRPLLVRQMSIFDVPQGRDARLLAGVAEARRRSDGRVGRLRAADLAHPLREARFTFEERGWLHGDDGDDPMVARHFTPARPLVVAEATPEGAPRLLRWRGRDERVAAVEATWATRHGWWDAGAIHRRYYRVRTVRGTLLVVYRDLPSGAWFLDAVLD